MRVQSGGSSLLVGFELGGIDMDGASGGGNGNFAIVRREGVSSDIGTHCLSVSP
jgi:hypothetical protein